MAQAHKAAAERVASKRNNGSDNTNGATNRAQERGATAGAPLNEKVQEIGKKMGDAMSDQVAAIAIKTCFENLQTGNFGDKVGQYLDALGGGVDCSIAQSYSLLDEELDPKFLLSSSGDSVRQLPPSLEGESI
jgi:hypothetical protein